MKNRRVVYRIYPTLISYSTMFTTDPLFLTNDATLLHVRRAERLDFINELPRCRIRTSATLTTFTMRFHFINEPMYSVHMYNVIMQDALRLTCCLRDTERLDYVSTYLMLRSCTYVCSWRETFV